MRRHQVRLQLSVNLLVHAVRNYSKVQLIKSYSSLSTYSRARIAVVRTIPQVIIRFFDKAMVPPAPSRLKSTTRNLIQYALLVDMMLVKTIIVAIVGVPDQIMIEPIQARTHDLELTKKTRNSPSGRINRSRLNDGACRMNQKFLNKNIMLT